MGVKEEDYLEALSRKGREERWKRILNSRNNRCYRDVRRKGLPRYLEKTKKHEKWIRVCKFRMEEDMRECKYWMDKEKKEWRMCGYERGREGETACRMRNERLEGLI